MQAATCPPVYHTRWKLHTVPLIAERHAKIEVVNAKFYGFWFDLTGNRIQVYRFSSRRSIQSTANWLFQQAMKTITKRFSAEK